jgi:hypothetical protein
MTEAETRIARTFRARDWVPLTPALIRIMSFVEGRADLALACINRVLLEGRLRAALVALDGTIKMRLEAPDWQRRTVLAPHIPAEGVRVEPYEEGRFVIWRADLDKEYPTNPATPASAADRQLYAADEPEPSQPPQAEQQPAAQRSPPPACEAAAALTSNAEGGPEDQPKLTEPDEPAVADPASSSAPKKRSRKKTPHGGAQTRRATTVLKRIFPEGRYPDENEMAWADVWIKFKEEYPRYAKEYSSKYGCPSPSTVKRVMGRAE